MNGHKKRTNLTASGMAAMLSCLLFFSCNDEDFLERNGDIAGNACDNICFGISPDGNVQTRGNVVSDVDGYTSGQFVLRSQDSADTLCVRAIVSDGVHSSAFGDRQAVTRGTPVTEDNFYDSFHVLAYWKKDGTQVEEQFYMDTNVAKAGDGLWSSTDTYYWPGAGHALQFYAWAPAADAFSTTPQSPATSTLAYTVPTEAVDQKDIVVARPDETPGDHNAAQELTFDHVCTAVRFVTGSQMQAGRIESVALKGVQYKGAYDLKSGSWKLENDVTDFTQSLGKEMTGEETDGTSVTASEGTFMMLPQILPTGAKVEVVFHSSATNTERILEAAIEGMEWPEGKTVTYKLSITPEYELEFISEPEMQDAHYVIYPIHIKVGDNVPGGWTMTSTSSEVTLRTDLTILTNRGFWIEEDKGETSISSTAAGDDITVYAFLAENTGDETREISLELRPTDMPEATPVTFTISQLCPSWEGNLGCERFEEYDEGYTGYPWGFLWDSDMKITYDAEEVPLLRRVILFFYLGLFNNDDFVKQDISIIPYYHHVVIDFSKISPLNVATSYEDGATNTWELYNFDGINEASSIMEMLEEWGIHPDKELPTNPTLFAARMCALKNKFNKEVTQEQGQTVERAVLKQENLVWYLPAMQEVPQMRDEEYVLQGNYWTSTAINDNQNAYKYTVGGSTSQEIRTSNLHVRAVRKKP